MANGFPYSDNEIRWFYQDAADEVEQVFIIADLCATSPAVMLKKLCDMGLVTDEVKVAALEEIMQRKKNHYLPFA